MDQIFTPRDRFMEREITLRSVEPELIVDELAHQQPALIRRMQADGEFRFALRQAEHTRRGDELQIKVRAPVDQPTQPGGQKIAAEAVRRADPYRSRRAVRELTERALARQDGRLQPVRHGERLFAGWRQLVSGWPAAEEDNP